jgi:hypothetical protein
MASVREVPALDADEQQMLEAFLDFQRETLLLKIAGLTDEQLATRSVPPSSMSLLGLVRHLSMVERWWWRIQVAGHRVPALYVNRQEPDLDFQGARADEAQADLRTYLDEVTVAREVAQGIDLDARCLGRHGQNTAVRWVYLHMIAEYARHNGHADLLRERIDGRTGV